METAGFTIRPDSTTNTRAFLSIPARHDLSRRMDSNWVASLIARHMVGKEEAGR